MSAKFAQADEAYEVGTPLPETKPADFSPRIAAFFEGKKEAKPVAIKPIEVSSAPKEHTFPVNKQRAGYSQRVSDALEQLSTGEILQMMNVLEAILADRKAQNEEHWKELSS